MREREEDMNAYELAIERANNPYLDPEANAQDFKVLAEALRHQAKTLTDEEIEKVFWEIANKKIDNPVMEFARAILRKAQEK